MCTKLTKLLTRTHRFTHTFDKYKAVSKKLQLFSVLPRDYSIMYVCTSCPVQLKTQASLNFHVKKLHPENHAQISSTKIQQEEAEPRRSQRVKGMIKFGKLPGVRDYTQGPFKVSSIALKTTEKKSKQVSNSNLLPLMETEHEDSYETTQTNDQKNDTVKHQPVSRNIFKPPRTSITPEGEMPTLSPQASPVRPGPGAAPGNRPGPKRTKQGQHWKYQDNDQKDETEPPTKTSKISENEAKPSPSISIRSSSLITPASVESKVDDIREIENGTNSDSDAISQRSTRSKSADDGSNKSESPGSTGDIAGKKTNGRTRIKPATRPGFSCPPCPVCGKAAFRNAGHHRNHLEVHEGLRPFLCPDPKCGLGYETEIKLLEHVTIRHSQDPKFSCPTCGRNFSIQRGLENHKCRPSIPVPSEG